MASRVRPSVQTLRVADGRFDTHWELDEMKRQWFPPADDPDRIPVEWLGVDVGFIYPAVDSDGWIYRWNRKGELVKAHDLPTAGPVTIRYLDGRVRTQKAYDTSELNDVLARARDEDYRMRLNALAERIVAKAHESGRGLALEDWRDFSRRRTAWTDVWKKLLDMAPSRGVTVRTVRSAYTSQTCPVCAHVARANRPTRDRFQCQSCGYQSQSDQVAAVNIEDKASHGLGTGDTLACCTNPPCARAVWKARLCCSCYFFKRRAGYLPTAEDIERIEVARNVQEFIRLMDVRALA